MANLAEVHEVHTERSRLTHQDFLIDICVAVTMSGWN
jgi:hypothetical protein